VAPGLEKVENPCSKRAGERKKKKKKKKERKKEKTLLNISTQLHEHLDECIVGCCAMFSDCIPTFQRNMLSLSSGLK
jgi:hypothetical protein